MSDEFETMEEVETEKVAFEEFAAKALRLPRKGSFEIMLSQHLATAVPAEPLLKIRLVIEAAFMVPRDKLELDLELLDIIYRVCLSFLNTKTMGDGIYISWNFPTTRENYKKYIEPWHDSRISLSFSGFTEAEIAEKRERLRSCDDVTERFWLLTTVLSLHPACFDVLRGEFLNWAIPKVMGVFEKLSRLIDPDLYKELILGMKPKPVGTG